MIVQLEQDTVQLEQNVSIEDFMFVLIQLKHQFSENIFCDILFLKVILNWLMDNLCTQPFQEFSVSMCEVSFGLRPNKRG